MDIAPVQSPIDASTLAPEQLAGNASLSKEQKIAEVARQFEAVMLRQILAESQKTVIHSKFTDDSAVAGIYQDMITKELAESISKAGTLGLAKSLQNQLVRQTVHKHPDPQAAASGSRESEHPAHPKRD